MKTISQIASTSYTGSTLLAILLGAHREIATIGELTGVGRKYDADTFECSCGAMLKECEFFRAVRERVVSKGGEFNYQDFQTRFYGLERRLLRQFLYGSLGNGALEVARDSLRKLFPKAEKNIDLWKRQNGLFIESVLEECGCRVFLDAAKQRSRIEFLSAIPNNRFKVIHLVRDVRGYVNSARKNAGQDLRPAAKHWAHTHREIARIAERFKIERKVVRYEDLCADTLLSLNEIFSFLGLEKQECYHFAPEELHLFGNRMRLKRDVEIRLDESWKQELSNRDAAIALKIGERRMEEFGYDIC